jgi:thiamine-monophosphate kinase
MGEFDLIRRYFARPNTTALRVNVGIGDDCAVLTPMPGMQLAVSSDMLVEGRHFLSTVNPAYLGHKALAVNLSDLAACGARPIGFTLALSLPYVDETWLAGFSEGLFALADQYVCPLVGGDTTRGPLNICITVFGEVPPGKALLRSGARVGDELWVSGTLGDARLALEVFRGNVSVPADVLDTARARMERPTPRVTLGLALRGIASAAIDVSDGLLGDLVHVLVASNEGRGVGVRIDTTVASQLMASATHEISVNSGSHGKNRLKYVLSGGDDYELAFTAAAESHDDVLAAGAACGTPVTCIGHIEAELGIRLVDGSGALLQNNYTSFDHFA